MITRRQLLIGSGALFAAVGLDLPKALAAVPGSDRKFLFVFNSGGWDPTRVFADGLDNPNVDMEPAAERARIGDLGWISHPDRPQVDAFFEGWGSHALVLNGIMVRSIAHEICTMIALTGASDGKRPDWPATLAYKAKDRFTLPHLVLSGPSFPGNLGVAVARTGTSGQLEALLSGDALAMSDVPVGRGPSQPAEDLVDRYLLRRAAARADALSHPGSQALYRDFHASLERAVDLKRQRYGMDFTATGGLDTQAAVAVDALRMGLSRAVTVSYPGSGFGWDTHANNDPQQSQLFGGLFEGLTALMTLLDATPGTSAPTLAEETVVVVLSEMGRTPQLNGFDGKDHWPFTSAMLLGPGITGGRTVGGWDGNFYGKLVDPGSGDVSASGSVLSAESVGATLLSLADVDPAEHLPGIAPLTGVLA